MFSLTHHKSKDLKSRAIPSVAAVLAVLGLLSCTSTAGQKARTSAKAAAKDQQVSVDKAGAEQMSKEGISLKAFGSEPFWAVEATQLDLNYSSPEELFSTDYTIVRKGSDIVMTSAESQLSLTIIDQPCADAGADMSYPLTAVLVLRGETKRGCAITPIPK